MSPDDLDQEHFDAAAEYAAEHLARHGVAKVRLAPGDMTEYRLIIAAPGPEWAYGDERPGKNYWVALCADFGTGYEWRGQHVDGGYAAEKWVSRSVSKGTRAWTGQVVARFLTATSEAMAARALDEAAR